MAGRSPGSASDRIGTLMARERPSTTDHPQPRDAREPCQPHGADRDRDRLRGGGPCPRARGDRPRRHPPRDRRAGLRHAAPRERGGGAGAARRGLDPLHRGRRHAPLREAIVDEVAPHKGIDATPEQVVVTPGAKPIMFYAMLALVEQGDEVIYPNPGFPIYESMVALRRRQAGPGRRCARRTTSGWTSTRWRRSSPTARG